MTKHKDLPALALSAILKHREVCENMADIMQLLGYSKEDPFIVEVLNDMVQKTVDLDDLVHYINRLESLAKDAD